MNGRISEYEFGVTCICRDGIFKNDLKYPNDLVLTEKEKEIYSKLKKCEIKELCPFQFMVYRRLDKVLHALYELRVQKRKRTLTGLEQYNYDMLIKKRDELIKEMEVYK